MLERMVKHDDVPLTLHSLQRDVQDTRSVRVRDRLLEEGIDADHVRDAGIEELT